jgi:RNA polymerase sigma-70 factor (ECF subfamily)
MNSTDDAATAQNQGAFPSTHWSKLCAVKGADSAGQRAALNFLIGHYWKPVYCYVRRKGLEEEVAAEIQDIFHFLSGA